jgi:hypothetical protein
MFNPTTTHLNYHAPACSVQLHLLSERVLRHERTSIFTT